MDVIVKLKRLLNGLTAVLSQKCFDQITVKDGLPNWTWQTTSMMNRKYFVPYSQTFHAKFTYVCVVQRSKTHCVHQYIKNKFWKIQEFWQNLLKS